MIVRSVVEHLRSTKISDKSVTSFQIKPELLPKTNYFLKLCRLTEFNIQIGTSSFFLSFPTKIRFVFSSELPSESDPIIHHFLTALAVCNTSFIVQEHRDLLFRLDYQPKYEGDNADDLVLCQTASNFGVRMISRSARTIVIRYIDANDKDKRDIEYEILCLLPFDSSRRRMSIIVRVNVKIYLYIKGAETTLWPYLSHQNNEEMKNTTEKHSMTFAEQGYRSLLVAYREISSTDFNEWFERYRQAANSLDNRDEAISEVATQIENNLILTGLTAVEDKLQEGVPHAIATLRCAGIKIWLLTGDKQATALSTAQAASLINVPQRRSSDDSSLSRVS